MRIIVAASTDRLSFVPMRVIRSERTDEKRRTESAALTMKTAVPISTEALRVNEAIGASLYVILGLLGIAFGANFCRNIFYNMGAVGDFLSAGTITFMGYAVGYKVLSGVGFLLLLMLGLLAPDPDDADAAPAVEAIEAAEAPAELPLEEAVDAAVATETVKEGVTE